MPRFAPIWRCSVCGTKMPNGERINCDPCEDWSWRMSRPLVQVCVAPYTAPFEERIEQIWNDPARFGFVVGDGVEDELHGRVKVGALDQALVEAVCQRIDASTVPETPEGTRLERIGPGLWRQVPPRALARADGKEKNA